MLAASVVVVPSALIIIVTSNIGGVSEGATELAVVVWNRVVPSAHGVVGASGSNLMS